MRIGVVSDTHGSFANTLAAVAQLTELQVDLIIHCGDIGSVQIVPLLSAWPAHFVLGNVDDIDSGLRWAIEDQGGTFHGRVGQTGLGRNRDFTGELGEHFRPHGILPTLAVHDILEL